MHILILSKIRIILLFLCCFFLFQRNNWMNIVTHGRKDFIVLFTNFISIAFWYFFAILLGSTVSFELIGYVPRIILTISKDQEYKTLLLKTCLWNTFDEKKQIIPLHNAHALWSKIICNSLLLFTHGFAWFLSMPMNSVNKYLLRLTDD